MKRIHLGDCFEVVKKLSGLDVAMVMSSPPYADKGKRYEDKEKWGLTTWAGSMLSLTQLIIEHMKPRVLCWVANDCYRGNCYQPACLEFIVDAHRAGLMLEKPAVWFKNASPCPSLPQYSDTYEYIICVKTEASPYFDRDAIATVPKYAAGGKFRQRNLRGERKEGSEYPKGKLTMPRNVRRHLVGGGLMGFDRQDSTLASQGKAPMTLSLAVEQILAMTRPGETVFDPFGGSGTTAVACMLTGRQYVLCELNEDQLKLAKSRIARTKEFLASEDSAKIVERFFTTIRDRQFLDLKAIEEEEK